MDASQMIKGLNKECIRCGSEYTLFQSNGIVPLRCRVVCGSCGAATQWRDALQDAVQEWNDGNIIKAYTEETAGAGRGGKG